MESFYHQHFVGQDKKSSGEILRSEPLEPVLTIFTKRLSESKLVLPILPACEAA